MGKFFLGIVFFIIHTSTGYSQANDTAKINRLNSKSEKVIDTDIVKAEALATEAYNLAVSSNYKYGQAEAAYWLAKISILKNEYGEAYKYINNAIEIFEKLKIKNKNAAALTVLGCYHQHKRNYIKAIQTHTKALAMAPNEDNLLQGDINLNIGIAYYYLNKYDTTKIYYNKALANYKKGNLTEKTFKCYRNLSLIARKQGNTDEAMELAIKALRIAEQNKQPVNIAAICNTIGGIYRSIKNDTKAIQYYKKAIQTLYGLPYKKIEANIYCNIANSYVVIDSSQLAISYSKKALQNYKAINADDKVSLMYNNIGVIYDVINKNDIAFNYFDTALQLAIKIKDNEVIIRAKNNLSQIYIEQKQYGKAKILLLENLPLIKKQNTYGSLEPCLHNLYVTYYYTGDYKKALSTYLQLDSLQDSTVAQAKVAAINELEIKYEAEKNKHAIKEQANSIALLEKDKKFYIIVSALLVVIALFSIVYLKNRSKQKILLQQIENRNLSKTVNQKDKELLSTSLSIAHKNELITEIKQRLEEIKKSGYSIRATVQEVTNLIDIDERNEKEWENFITLFKGLHPDFIKNLVKESEQLNQYDIRLCSLIRLNLSNQEIKNILNISTTSLTSARYRLRKKLNIEGKTDLVVFLTKLG